VSQASAIAEVRRRHEARRAAVLHAMPVNQLVTAQTVASACGVTPRTVYRYIAELRAEGEAIKGGRGVGYMRRASSGAGRR
jgi:predicted DNA-binding transcriptional regulator YafY